MDLIAPLTSSAIAAARGRRVGIFAKRSINAKHLYIIFPHIDSRDKIKKKEVVFMPFEIVRNDIVNMTVDVIVNTADHLPEVGYGTDSVIHKKAGRKLLKERKKIGVIPYDDARISPAFDLHAKYVIHAVSPIWQGGENNEEILLSHCYERSLALALEYGCESIAFPFLASGNNGFPNDLALDIAVNAIKNFLVNHEMHIYLVVYDKTSFELSEKLFSSVKSFIEERYIDEQVEKNFRIEDTPFFGSVRLSRPMSEIASARSLECEDEDEICRKESVCFSAPLEKRSLDNLMDELEDTFSESLMRIIDQKGLKDPEVYKKANIDRKLFNKIKNNPDYRPSKNTAIAFAIALGLNLDETKDLIGRAGYALTHSSKADIIIEYFITNGNYNIYEINEVLFAFDQNLIGA